MIVAFVFNASASAHVPDAPILFPVCVLGVFHCFTNHAILVVFVAHLPGAAQ